jgi:hypothetical protein
VQDSLFQYISPPLFASAGQYIEKRRHETSVYVYQPRSGRIACKLILIVIKKDKEINKFNNKACIN